MHPAEYITRYTDKCAETGHDITETRETQIGGAPYTYNTCKCGTKTRI